MLPHAHKPTIKRATEGSSGYDLYASFADLEGDIVPPGKCALIPTGVSLEMENGFEAQVRSRSGLAIKNGVFVLNAPGTIDADYRGEVCVILANFGARPFVVNDGDRIAQLVFMKLPLVNLIYAEEGEELVGTSRGVGGFGSTGTGAN